MKLVVLALVLCSSVFAQANPVVRFSTNLGDIDVTLLADSAPKTVTNFLNYVNRGAYTNSFIHRSVPNFVVQGGGFIWQNSAPNVTGINQDPPVENEYRVSNTRGTIAMAKLESGPNTATNQWFFNLGDNSANLDAQNGGFTVFGRVLNDEGLAVMDRIGAVQRYSSTISGIAFESIPLTGYTGGAIQQRHFVTINSITVLNIPSIATGGIVSAGAFGGYAYGSPGTFIEIFGSGFAPAPGRIWASTDFRDGNAPMTLDDISVSINGVRAFVSYIGPNQINVQLPAEIPTGGTVSVVVTNKGIASPSVQFPIRERAPALLAPAGFRVGDKQYVYAAHTDGRVVSNGTIPDIPAAPAVPGETLIFFGLGFGSVTPSTPNFAGQIAQGQTAITAPLEFKFGGFPGEVRYAGLAPGLVGLYQFNVVVPANAEDGDVPLAITVAGEAVPQTLLIPVRR